MFVYGVQDTVVPDNDVVLAPRLPLISIIWPVFKKFLASLLKLSQGITATFFRYKSRLQIVR